MKRLLIILLLTLAVSPEAVARQDPDDPGIQDSIILGEIFIDPGSRSVELPIYVVTDDSVMFYNIPLTWHVDSASATPNSPNSYFPPVSSWDVRYDSVVFSQNLIRQIGFAEIDTGSHNVPLMTSAQRVEIISIRFELSEFWGGRRLTIDTTYDDRNGSLLFGLVDGRTEFTPDFRRGYIYVPVGVDEDALGLPTQFCLSQNYPNPFNAQTVISYSLPTASDVTIDIFDIPGRKIETFANGMMPAGEHKVIWDATGQSSGIYFYRIKAGAKTETRKMVLIK